MNVFDIVNACILGYTEEIGDNYEINSEKLDILREYCDTLDMFISNHDGKSATVDVIPESNYISIELDLFDFIYEKKFKSPAYLDLLERAISVVFTNKGEDRIGVEFIFPSVWDKKS